MFQTEANLKHSEDKHTAKIEASTQKWLFNNSLAASVSAYTSKWHIQQSFAPIDPSETHQVVHSSWSCIRTCCQLHQMRRQTHDWDDEQEIECIRHTWQHAPETAKSTHSPLHLLLSHLHTASNSQQTNYKLCTECWMLINKNKKELRTTLTITNISMHPLQSLRNVVAHTEQACEPDEGCHKKHKTEQVSHKRPEESAILCKTYSTPYNTFFILANK